MLENEKGASAVEFAIILPLFLILVFGIIEFGVIMYDKAVVTNASREGARFGVLFDPSVHTNVEIIDRVNSFACERLSLINLGESSECPLDAENIKITTLTGTGQDRLTVSVTYPYKFIFLPNFLPGLPQALSLNGTTTMRME
jgi:Flp pilus assembly protein TadG